MTNPTSNYSFQMPTSTDLVTDLPADFEVFGQAVDTRLKALQPGTTLGDLVYSSATANTNTRLPIGTTGQVLAVSGGVPAWTTTADVTPLTTKGDLFTFTTVDARLAVGNNGETLVADSSTSTGLRYQSNYAAGKNKIINGDCAINQRAFTTSTSSGNYLVDRFVGGNSGGTVTYSVQQFTPGTAPVAGYEAKQFMRLVVSGQSAAGDFTTLSQEIEDVRTFAGQTVTVSFWAKANTGTPSVSVDLLQKFGSGGSPSSSVSTAAGKNAITTSWARYSYTVAVPSISGKTIGTTDNTSSLRLRVWVSAGSTYNTETTSLGTQANTFDIWGVQVEASNTATAFQTATGTLQGELAACQRYYRRLNAGTAYGTFKGVGVCTSTTKAELVISLDIELRTNPSFASSGSFQIVNGGASTSTTSLSSGQLNTTSPQIEANAASGLTTGFGAYLRSNNSTASYIEFSAEL